MVLIRVVGCCFFRNGYVAVRVQGCCKALKVQLPKKLPGSPSCGSSYLVASWPEGARLVRYTDTLDPSWTRNLTPITR